MAIRPETDCLWGKDFFDTYMRHAKKRSYKNEILHQAASLALIGQSLRNVWLRADQTMIDCRIHPFVIQSSGTGKNSAFSMMKDVSRAADIPFDEHGTASTAGIMGTVNQDGEEQVGDLAGRGFVAWKEAQTLLKSAEQTHSSDILEVINMALDSEGKVEKSLSGGKLEYSSRTSLFCTTYDPEPNGQIELVRQGFLPRMLFVYRNMPEGFYDYVNQRRAKGIPTPDDDENTEYVRDFNSDVKKLGNTLRYIEDQVWEHGKIYREDDDDSYYANASEQIDYFYGVVPEAKDLMDPTSFMDEVMEQYSVQVRKIAITFKTRMFDTVYRLAAALAAVDYDEENGVYVSRRILKRHVKYARQIAKRSFKAILDFIEDYMQITGKSELQDLETVVTNISRRNGGFATVKELMSETYRSKKDIKSDLATLNDMGKVTVVSDMPVTALSTDGKVTTLSKEEVDYDKARR